MILVDLKTSIYRESANQSDELSEILVVACLVQLLSMK